MDSILRLLEWPNSNKYKVIYMYTLSHIYILMHTELMVLYLNLYFLFSRVFTGIAKFDGEYLS